MVDNGGILLGPHNAFNHGGQWWYPTRSSLKNHGGQWWYTFVMIYLYKPCQYPIFHEIARNM